MSWALVCYVFAVVAGVLGFTGIAGDASWVGKVFFFVFLVLTFVSLIASTYRIPR